MDQTAALQPKYGRLGEPSIGFSWGKAIGAAVGCAFLVFRPPLTVFGIMQVDTIQSESFFSWLT